MDDYALALAHYRLTFPTLASLGTASATWRTEYDRVSSIGLSSTTVIGSSSEGATASAIRNFSQRVLMTALHAVRADELHARDLVIERKETRLDRGKLRDPSRPQEHDAPVITAHGDQSAVVHRDGPRIAVHSNEFRRAPVILRERGNSLRVVGHRNLPTIWADICRDKLHRILQWLHVGLFLRPKEQGQVI